jgi:hypothetical protein
MANLATELWSTCSRRMHCIAPAHTHNYPARQVKGQVGLTYRHLPEKPLSCSAGPRLS